MKKKKEIPLTLLKIATEIVRKYPMIDVVFGDGSIMTFKDNDPTSNFRYAMVRYKIVRGTEVLYEVNFFPESSERLFEYSTSVEPYLLLEHVTKWAEIVKSFDETPSIFDDPILKAYEEEFEKEFDIMDDDANEQPFSVKQQLYLDDYLENAIDKLENLKQNKSEDVKGKISDVQKDAQHIRMSMTNNTKREVMKKMSKFWAKCMKLGIEVIKELTVQVAVEGFKRLLLVQG